MPSDPASSPSDQPTYEYAVPDYHDFGQESDNEASSASDDEETENYFGAQRNAASYSVASAFIAPRARWQPPPPRVASPRPS